jgi:RND superfamily putative drug exporter
MADQAKRQAGAKVTDGHFGGIVFGWIARGVTTRPWLVIGAWVVIAAAIIAFAPSIGTVTNSDQSSFLPASAESARAAALVKTAFPDGQGATAVIVVKRTDGTALTDADIAMLGGLAQRLNQNRPDALRGVQFDPGQSIAPNRAVGLLGAAFAAAPEDVRVRAAVTTLRARTATELAGTGLTAGMTGQAAIVVDNKQAFADAEKIVTVATLALIVVLLLLIFRSPVAALLPLLTVGLVFGVATSLTAAAATAFSFEVGQELPTMLTVVLFGIGTDYILFLLFRYRERLRAGDSPRDAIVGAVERVGEAIFSAAFAVIAAFGALVLATLGFFASLGPALAIGVFVMLLAALTLVPATVTLLGRRTFWPSNPARPKTRRSGFAMLGRFVGRRPAIVVAGTVVVLGGLAAGVLTFAPDYDPIGQLPAGTEATTAFADLTRGFPAGALQPTEVYLSADRPITPDELGAFTKRLAAVPGVASPLAPRVAADGRTAEVPLILSSDPYAGAALDLVVGPLRDAARAAAPPGTRVLVGGQTMAFADIRAATQRDLAVIFPVAAMLFVLILAGLLRALLAPIYLVLMVVGGFAATLGASALVFQRGLGHAGLAFSIPIILYLFVTAIGTDYNILVTARLREEVRDGRSPRDAAAIAIEHAGPSVAAAGLILAGTFGALTVSGVPFFVEIGFAVTLGILLVAFVVSLLLVPATTALLGRAAWWPGRRRPPASASFMIVEPKPGRAVESGRSV